jgi:hypothetical protein
MRAGFSLLALACLALAGCASYTIQPISSAELQKWDRGKLDEGFVFYQSELYFLVAPSAGASAGGGKTNAAGMDAKGKAGKPSEDEASTFTVTPMYLPNPSKAYRITTFNFLAKSDFAFNFKDGWQLSSIADKADNSTIANTIAGELKTLLSASGVPGVGFVATPQTPLQSFLLHPRYSANGIIDGFGVIALPKELKSPGE